MALVLDIVYGAIGSGYMLYGWREQDAEFLLSGFVLVIYPYFLSNAALILALGALVAVVPVARRKGWF